MKKLSDKIQELDAFISEHHIQSISFDIDGTLYAMIRVKIRWWQKFFQAPLKAKRFLDIKKKWELRRQQISGVVVSEEDVAFFESFLMTLLDPGFVPVELRNWIQMLKERGIQIFFLTDHGAQRKLEVLNFSKDGVGINCLKETGELKPHQKITYLLLSKYLIQPASHLHLGDRWTDEEQARMLECEFSYFVP